MVAYFHLSLTLTRYGGFQLPLKDVGSAGVDVFFVLSGFIIWVTTVEKNLSTADFLYRRWFRIVPLYWLVTLFVAATLIFAPSIFNSLRFDLKNTVYSLFFIPALNEALHEIVPTYIQGWTINYEIFFYMVFALVMLTPRRFWLALITLTLLACTILGFLGLHGGNVQLDFWTRPIVLEFLFGVLLGAMFLNKLIPSRLVALACIAVAVITLLTTAFFALTFPPSGANILRVAAWGAPAALLVYGLVALEVRGYVVPLKLLSALGDWSYSIYMTHIAVIPAVAIAWRKLGMNFVGVSGVAFVGAELLVISIVGGIVYHMYERPILNYSNRRRRKLLSKYSGNRSPSTANEGATSSEIPVISGGPEQARPIAITGASVIQTPK